MHHIGESRPSQGETTENSVINERTGSEIRDNQNVNPKRVKTGSCWDWEEMGLDEFVEGENAEKEEIR